VSLKLGITPYFTSNSSYDDQRQSSKTEGHQKGNEHPQSFFPKEEHHDPSQIRTRGDVHGIARQDQTRKCGGNRNGKRGEDGYISFSFNITMH